MKAALINKYHLNLHAEKLIHCKLLNLNRIVFSEKMFYKLMLDNLQKKNYTSHHIKYVVKENCTSLKYIYM